MYWRIIIISFLFIFNATSIAQSSFMKALKLDGKKQYLEIPNKDYLNYGVGRDFTFEIKFKADSLKPTTLLSKFDINEKGYFGNGILINLSKIKDSMNDSLNWKFPEILYGYYFPQTIEIFRNGGGLASTCIPYSKRNEWNHYAFYQSENGERLEMMNEHVFYNGYNSTENVESISPMYIGGYPSSDSMQNDLIYFNGQVDEIRIWNKKRSKTDILSCQNDTLSAIYYTSADSGLVAYYRFDKIEKLTLADGSTYDYCIRDLSLNNNHAKIINGGILVEHEKITSANGGNESIITDYTLYQNYPNPFNPRTTINYSIPKQVNVTIIIYDALGREVTTLINEEKSIGNYSVEFNATNLSSGIYFYQMRINNNIQTKQMILLK